MQQGYPYGVGNSPAHANHYQSGGSYDVHGRAMVPSGQGAGAYSGGHPMTPNVGAPNLSGHGAIAGTGVGVIQNMSAASPMSIHVVGRDNAGVMNYGDKMQTGMSAPSTAGWGAPASYLGASPSAGMGNWGAGFDGAHAMHIQGVHAHSAQQPQPRAFGQNYLFADGTNSAISSPHQRNGGDSARDIGPSSLSKLRSSRGVADGSSARRAGEGGSALGGGGGGGRIGGIPTNGLPRGAATKSTGDGVHGFGSPFAKTLATPGPATPATPLQQQATPSQRHGARLDAPTPGRIDPFYTQKDRLSRLGVDADARLAEDCVTVYGFFPNAASLVLRQFEDYGCIVKKKIEPGGNWMHLQYSSNLEAAKALAKDGKILDHKIMIGVRRCIDMDFTHIVTDGGEEDRPLVLNSPRQKREGPRTLDAPTAPGLIHGDATTGAPHRDAGFLSLAREYILGI